jgi:signal transduction histidine kinase
MITKPLSPGQRLLCIFVVTIFVPGVLLAVFGANALWQQRRLAAQQLQTDLEDAADLASRILGDELNRLQALLTGRLPAETIFQGFPADESWALVSGQADGLNVYPPRSLPYELRRAPMVWADPGLLVVTRLETEEVDWKRIEAEYRRLLQEAKPDLIPEIKHRLARTLRKAGNTPEAKRLWGEVLVDGGFIGPLPADFVASSELESMDSKVNARFCDDLVGGRWLLEKVRYLYYLSEVCHADDPRLALADATEALFSTSSAFYESSDGIYLAFRNESPFRLLVLSPKFLAAQLLPRLTSAFGKDMDVVRVAINGKDLYDKPISQSSPQLSATRTLDRSGVSFRVDVAPVDAAGLQAATARTTRVYLVILTGVVILLGFGGYFMVRTIQRELEVARMKSDFVSTVSHEFRSPLTGIRQLGELLSRGRVSDPQKRQQYYDLIVHESNRLARLVENVLDFSRMEDGRKQYSFEVLDTSAWLTSVADEFQREAARSGHRLEACIPDQLPVVRGDREALSTAVRNLLDNACKYSPQSETVWLDAEASNGGVRVQVRDRGVGIPDAEKSQIFEKFYRGGGELAKQVKGAGLGLSLVRHIVASHHGQVSVESREGEGSTFSIHLSGVA